MENNTEKNNALILYKIMTRYFENITTAEELKNKFRELCQTMHPDKGGNADEFKNMMNQYEEAQKRAGGWTKQERDHVASLRRGSLLRCSFGWGCGEYYAVYLGNNKYIRRFSEDFDSVASLQGFAEDSRAYGHTEAQHVRPLSQEYGVGVYLVDGEGAKIYTEEETREFIQRADNFDKWQKIRKEEREAEEARQRAARQAEEREKMAFWLDKLTKCEPITATDWRERSKQETKRKNVTKKNVRQILAHYFPGVKFTVLDSGRSYGASSEIVWQDGPTVSEVEAVEELARFTGYTWFYDQTDYSERRGVASWQEWREMFGEFSDDKIKYVRTMSAESDAAISAALEAMGADWAGRDEEGKITNDTGTAWADSLQIDKFITACGCSEQFDEKGERVPFAAEIYQYWTRCDTMQHNERGGSVCRVYASRLAEIARKYYTIPQAQQEAQRAEADAPKFTPHHGKTYREIIKALGGNKFVKLNDGAEWDELTELDPAEAAERLAKGEPVGLGKPWEYEHRRKVSKVDAGGLKTQQKRRDKFAAVGFGVVITWRNYSGVTFDSVTPETLEALRQDAADVEQQRKAWEESQTNPQPKTQTATQSAPDAENVGEVLAEGDGVQLVRTDKGAQFMGETYSHKDEIKATGARWFRLGQCWTIKPEQIAEAVALVRSWAQNPEPVAEAETTTTDPQPEALQDAEEIRQEPDPQPEAVADDPEPVAEAETVEDFEPVGEDEPKTAPDFVTVARFAHMLGEVVEILPHLAEVLKRSQPEPLPEYVAQLVSLCQLVADIFHTVRQCKQGESVPADLVAVLDEMREGLSGVTGSGTVAATLCAVFAGYYPEERATFNDIGARAWAASAEQVPTIWDELTREAVRVSASLGDILQAWRVAA